MMSEEQAAWFGKRFFVGMITLILVFAIRDYGWSFVWALGAVIGLPVVCVGIGALLFGAHAWLKNNWY